MKVIARHKWVSGAVITESYDENNEKLRRFTATIEGFRNWKLYEGQVPAPVNKIVDKVQQIRDRIREGDQTVFQENSLVCMVSPYHAPQEVNKQ